MEIQVYQAVLDANPASIAVIDGTGVINAVNRAWVRYGEDNDGDKSIVWAGVNYLEVCRKSASADNQHAEFVLSGFESVRSRKAEQYQYLYPCHSPTHLAWYSLRIIPLPLKQRLLYMLAHEDRTIEVLTRQALEREVNVDELTGLFSRRGCDYQLKQQWRRDLRSRSEMSILAIELDGYEDYRTQFGGVMGDYYLRLVARALKAVMQRPDDFAARMEGGEFAVVLGTTTQLDALAIAEKFRQNIEQLSKLALGAHTGKPLTVSIGVWSVTPHRHLSVAALFDKAQAALCRAKSLGQNCVST